MTKEIDTFWEVFNAKRCKTAMLVLSILVILFLGAIELSNKQSAIFEYLAILSFGFWSGRMTKAKEIS
ncbi:MAG: hypothetical protein KAT83_01265 [Candidatus Aenigmarchaeota archaeon]|nr:hypothetical protein [Candidatus Aenigmarchaeota archaeon]